MENKKSKLKEQVIEIIKTAIACAIVVLTVSNFITRPVFVKGSSMYPTLVDGEYGFANILGTYIDGFDRFDVVVIYVPENKEYLVKRIIGLPGETISYKDDQLYVNGEAVDEPFLDTQYRSIFTDGFTTDIEEITLGDDEYYCLGDNRPFSRDSRYYGTFSRKQLKSKGLIAVWPLSKIGIITW